MTDEKDSPRDNCAVTRAQTQRGHWTSELAREMTQAICSTYEDEEGVNHIDGANMPQREEVIDILEKILEVLFPGYSGKKPVSRTGLEFSIGDLLNQIFQRLVEQVERAFAYRCNRERREKCNCHRQAEAAVIELLGRLPELRKTLKTDVIAAMEGDPAAKSTDEVVIAYPGFKAISVHRVAHELYCAGVPLVPRVMGEYAHTVTGIDIHPGATVGKSFFTDHGTGVVIGETAVLGDHVKLYQGVTLGALSFPKDQWGRLIRGNKRHPNIEDNVTVYAGATILGNITIGHDSTIGGNVWLTESVPPCTKVTLAPPDLSMKPKTGKPEA